jgi:NAD(P)-dependent dehydrogenase (short-subunit alcohol dehydrogenase family)
MDISCKMAVVTAAASGIGLGITAALAEAGGNVVTADIRKDADEEARHRRIEDALNSPWGKPSARSRWSC